MTVSVVLLAVAGALTWSFLEYVIHRWAGHGRRFKKNPFGVEHIRHHIEGNYFAPTWTKVLFTIAVALGSGAIAYAIGGVVALAYVAGLVGFYAVYEIIHRREHTHPGFGAYGRWARKHHFTHHFVDARVNHGVTSPIWDFVFGTYRKPGTIKVPPKLSMPWLRDPATGQVRSDWADTFVLG